MFQIVGCLALFSGEGSGILSSDPDPSRLCPPTPFGDCTIRSWRPSDALPATYLTGRPDQWLPDSSSRNLGGTINERRGRRIGCLKTNCLCVVNQPPPQNGMCLTFFAWNSCIFSVRFLLHGHYGALMILVAPQEHPPISVKKINQLRNYRQVKKFLFFVGAREFLFLFRSKSAAFV